MTTVLTVIVSFNRAQLLQQSIQAVLKQTRTSDLLVVDNASTDSTQEMLRTLYPTIRVKRMQHNTGGAGGFSYGVKTAIEENYGFAWLMDDDAVARPDALENLLITAGRSAFISYVTPLVVSSSDGRELTGHAGPARRTSRSIDETENLARQSIEWCSFVGPLINLRLAKETHLPCADFFIWNDDIEYTARLSRHGVGVRCLSAILEHPPMPEWRDFGGRLALYCRNLTWLMILSGGVPRRFRSMFLRQLVGLCRGQLSRSSHPWRDLRNIAVGVARAIVTRPTKEWANQGFKA